ncbi:hydantoinase B/oxoprolinase family protein [Nesterenkonia ebinurensis]|uniref:hydantoinase B/oxoprolinase family protein n=1 Tax=Nesterenkonia ebinurensis TaxID=2608252 RepID=UPI00123DED67|nr:hydantoinase B/oxoprolinase family protein [Nesterenkonia ebinurensis]
MADTMTRAVVWRGLIAAANDAGRVLKRTAFSGAIQEGQDFSIGVFDEQGRMIVQGDFSPGHLGAMPSVIKHVEDYFPRGSLSAGDAVLLNDLFMGSGHLLDFFLATPVFVEKEFMGYAVSCAHMADVGGASPGSQQVEGIFDFYQEGIRFLPTLMWHEGEAVGDVHRILAANVRVPDTVLGDIQAMRNANLVVEKRFSELVMNQGKAAFRQVCDEVLSISEAAMRAEISKWPNGVYSATDYYDDFGPGTDSLKISVQVTVNDDSVDFDFSNSSPQTRSGINAVRNYLDSYTLFSVKSMADDGQVPQNAGSMAPINITCTPGTVVSAIPPAGGGARAIMQQRIVDVIFQAMAEAIPDRVLAPSSHWANPIIGGYDPETGKQFVNYEIVVGGFGGRPDRDGVEAMSASFNIDTVPVEIAEAAAPLRVLRHSFIQDSAGVGQFRGGFGVRKDIQFFGKDMTLTNLGERHVFQPPGILGGEPGISASTVLNPDKETAKELHSKGTYFLDYADVVSFRLSGGGGYGSASERSAKAVAADVEAGLVTESAALANYPAYRESQPLKTRKEAK